MQVISWAIRIAVFIILLIFALKNTELVRIDFLSAQYLSPLVVVVLTSFGLGCLVGILSVSGKMFHQYREIGKLKKQLTKASKSETTIPAKALPLGEIDSVAPAVATLSKSESEAS